MPLARGVAVAAPAVVVAIRGERRVPLRVLGETLAGVFFEPPRRRRLFPSFLGVLRMLKAIDWRRSTCGVRSVNLLLWGLCQQGFTWPSLTCLRTGAAFFWASAVLLCLRPSCRSLGVIGRGKQLVAFLDCEGEDN